MKPQQPHAAAERSEASDQRNKLQVSTKPGNRASAARCYDVQGSWRTGMRRQITRTLGKAEKSLTDESDLAEKSLRPNA